MTRTSKNTADSHAGLNRDSSQQSDSQIQRTNDLVAEPGHLRRYWRAWLLGLVALSLLTGFLWFRNRPNDQAVSKVTMTDFDRVIRSKDVGEIVEFAKNLEARNETTHLPAEITMLQKQLALADRIDTIIEIDDPLYAQAKSMKIEILRRMDHLNRRYFLEDDVTAIRFQEYVVQYLSHNVREISETAHVAWCYSLANEMALRPTNENYQAFHEQIMESVDFHIDSPRTIQRLVLIASLVDKADLPRARKEEFNLDLGDRLIATGGPEVRQVGVEVHDRIVTADIDFEDLRFKIQIGNEQAARELDRFVDRVAQTPEAGPKAYAEAIRAIELLTRVRFPGYPQEALSKLTAAAANVPDVDSRREVQRELNLFGQRENLPGKQIELAGISPDGKPVVFADFEDRFVAIAFANATVESMEAMQTFANLGSFHSEGVNFVVVLDDAEPDFLTAMQQPSETSRVINDVIEHVQKKCPQSKILSLPASQQLIEQCPVRHLPYFVLLDPNHRVIQSNVAVERFRELIDGELVKRVNR